MKSLPAIIFPVCLFSSLSICGCGTSPVASEPPVPAKADTASHPAKETPKVQPADSKSDEAPPAIAQFVPPHPNRLDPFQRPAFNQVAARDAQAIEQDIQLKGFVNVDGLQAILIIDDVLRRVKVGDRHDGIEVIDIEPPRVILQRDRTRLNVSLYNSIGRQRDDEPLESPQFTSEEGDDA